MNFTPNFDRLRTAILCEGEPDHVPFFDVTIWAGHKERLLGRKPIGVADEVEFAQRMGYDFVTFNTGIHLSPQLLAAMHGKKTVADAGMDDELVERNWAAGGSSTIRDEADFEAFDWPDPDDFSLDFLFEADQVLPPNMKVIVNMGKVFNPVWWLTGFETFSMALYDNPALIARMFDKVGGIQVAILERVLEHPSVGAQLHGDDIAFNTSLMVSPNMLRHYAFPWFKRMVDITHEQGVLALYHSDGKLDTVLEDIVSMGFDGLHPIDPGAMDIVETKKRIAGRMGIMGNIDLGYTLTLGTPAEVEAEVRERLRDIAPGGGYCLGSANSVPDYVPFENYIAMRDAWWKYGKYPIL